MPSKRMTGSALRAQAKAWFGNHRWREPLAQALGLDPSTISRMIAEDRVTGPVQAAVRTWQEYGLPSWVSGKKGRQ